MKIAEIDPDYGLCIQSSDALGNDVQQFPGIFEELETNKTELRIGSYGVKSTTMEEIFLRSSKMFCYNPANL